MTKGDTRSLDLQLVLFFSSGGVGWCHFIGCPALPGGSGTLQLACCRTLSIQPKSLLDLGLKTTTRSE